MLIFATYLFNEFFTVYDKISDPNKDIEGKGTHERFNECIGEEMDEFLMPMVADMQKNLLEPLDCLDKFIPHLEHLMGYDTAWEWFFIGGLDRRRNILRIITKLYQIRSTIYAHEVMFAWVGLDCVITELFADEGLWDDAGFWDDGGVWDTFCPPCGVYNIALTGSYMSLPDDVITAISTIILFNKPIDAIVGEVTYNGGGLYGDFNADFNDDFLI